MKNFLLLSIYLLLGALSVSGQKKSLDTFYSSYSKGVKANKKGAANNSNPIPQFGNLVTRPSFRKIYRSNFSSVSGTNNLPTSQIIVTLNKPALQVGQLIPIHWNDTKTIPFLGLYPYITGRLNDDDEFQLTKSPDIDPKIGSGIKLVFLPIGLSKGTNFFFDPSKDATKLFIEKNNLLKEQLKKEYNRTQIDSNITKLKKDINDIQIDIEKTEFLLRYQKNRDDFRFSIENDKVLLIETQTIQSIPFTLLDIEKVIVGKWDKSGRINRLGPSGDLIQIIFQSALQDKLHPSELVDDIPTLTKTLRTLKEKKVEKAEEELKLEELLETQPKFLKFLGVKSKLEKFIDDKVYEAEKDAPYTVKHFLWFTYERSGIVQSANVFRNNAIEENLSFRKKVRGVSANYSRFSKKWVWSFSVKYDVSTTNKFFDDKIKSYIDDSLITGTQYKTSEIKEAYDVNTLSNTQFNEKLDKGIWTVGGTGLFGDKKKYGLTINYRWLTDTKVANLKIGAIIPALMDNAKAEQTNIILELVLPDVWTKAPKSITNQQTKGEKLWDRHYFNLKVGIPINLL